MNKSFGNTFKKEYGAGRVTAARPDKSAKVFTQLLYVHEATHSTHDGDINGKGRSRQDGHHDRSILDTTEGTWLQAEGPPGRHGHTPPLASHATSAPKPPTPRWARTYRQGRASASAPSTSTLSTGVREAATVRRPATPSTAGGESPAESGIDEESVAG